LTHYYLLFLWAVEGLALLLAPRRTRAIRRPWIATVLTGIVLSSVAVSLSPGILATARETLNRFPALPVRWQDLQLAVMDLLINWRDPRQLPLALAIILAVMVGWVAAWKRDALLGALLALWGIVPVAVVALIPEAIQARYMVIALPALAFGLAACIAAVRSPALRWIFAVVLAAGIGAQWNHSFPPPDTTFSDEVAYLHQHAHPGDTLLLNNPWISLLTTYYPLPEWIEIASIPDEAPPGFSAADDLPRLGDVAGRSKRLWVAYNASSFADPGFGVSSWLAENMYCVDQFKDLALYVPATAVSETLTSDIHLDSQTQLTSVAADQTATRPGEALRIHLEWTGADLSWWTKADLRLIGPDQAVWASQGFSLGPVRQDIYATLPSPWSERRGLFIPPGTPPGSYTLMLRAGRDTSTDVVIGTLTVVSAPEPVNPPAGPHSVFLPLVARMAYATSQTTGQAFVSSYLSGIPQQGAAPIDLDGNLRLLGLSYESHRLVQSFPLNLELWWQMDHPSSDVRIQLRLVGRGGTLTTRATYPLLDAPLGPSFYPSEYWKSGEVVRQQVQAILPRDLPAGTYTIQIQTTSAEAPWKELLTVAVETRERTWRPPLFRHRSNVRFADVLRLRGYRVSDRELRPGETATLAVYWQAQTNPDRVYAVFNHLRNADNVTVWQQDSWPQGGYYTTDRWVQGEVVAETYTLEIPQDAPPGIYTLFTGVYDPQTVTRLAVVDAAGERYVNDEVPWFTIRVLP
ncbi:MAG: hypothetical protein JXB35_01495, partial [Anaerolineae bacterium]|nr:hypothetical protein [Anaerolineae bacterium]